MYTLMVYKCHLFLSIYYFYLQQTRSTSILYNLEIMLQGVQIANEGSTADRNQITQQLQSLKTQILTLKRAIDKKREEHIKSVAEHNKVHCTYIYTLVVNNIIVFDNLLSRIRIKTFFFGSCVFRSQNLFFYFLSLYQVFTELESDIDWLTEKEGEFKTQPLLTTTVEDVESHLLQHNQLTEQVGSKSFYYFLP